MIRRGVAFAIVTLAVACVSAAVLARGRSVTSAEREATTMGLAPSSIRDVSRHPFSPTPEPVAAVQPAPPVEMAAALQGLSLVQPRFQRAGYGSKAMLSFTVQNRNDFAVKDIAMRCEFGGTDGRFVTSRTRTLDGTVKMKSRKRYGPTLIGFVGITHSQARCAIVTANRAERV